MRTPNAYVLYRRVHWLPAGTLLFSLLFEQAAPYFRSARPRFRSVAPNRVELVVRRRRRVTNHLGTVHVIAICNGLEAAMGALAEASVRPGWRWIPQGMEVRYPARATTDVLCIAETDPGRWTSGDPDVPVRVRALRHDGTVVVEGVISLWVTPVPPASSPRRSASSS